LIDHLPIDTQEGIVPDMHINYNFMAPTFDSLENVTVNASNMDRPGLDLMLPQDNGHLTSEKSIKPFNQDELMAKKVGSLRCVSSYYSSQKSLHSLHHLVTEMEKQIDDLPISERIPKSVHDREHAEETVHTYRSEEKDISK
jgi:hypothetical protein